VNCGGIWHRAAMTSTPEVESLLADHPDAVAVVARLLRRTLLDGHPPLVERVRRGWHSINFHDPGAGFVCAVFPLADRVQLVFERGAQLPDPDGLLTGTGRQSARWSSPTRPMSTRRPSSSSWTTPWTSGPECAATDRSTGDRFRGPRSEGARAPDPPDSGRLRVDAIQMARGGVPFPFAGAS
jgi:hypothetical protein